MKRESPETDNFVIKKIFWEGKIQTYKLFENFFAYYWFHAFLFFPTITYICSADKGFALPPRLPPLNGHVRYECFFGRHPLVGGPLSQYIYKYYVRVHIKGYFFVWILGRLKIMFLMKHSVNEKPPSDLGYKWRGTFVKWLINIIVYV